MDDSTSMTRRDFLAKSAGASVAAMVGGSPLAKQNERPARTSDTAVDVLIVGAGLAGLYAARLVRRAGLTVKVLEARDRVGGRVLSRRLADNSSVDLGAQWIGPGQRRMYALAREYGLETIETHTQGDLVVGVDGNFRRTSGTTYPMSWIGKLDAFHLGWRIDRVAKKLHVTEPWRHPQAERLDSVSFTEWLKDTAFSEEARTYWRHIAESGMCASSDDFSALEVSLQVATIGGLERLETAEHEFFEEGAQTIAQRLVDELNDSVHLLAPVRALRHEGQLVRAITDRGEFSGQHVILALPPQLIEKILFDSIPNCPPGRTREDLVLGQVVKNVVVYDRAWWRDAGLSGMATTPEEPIGFLVDTSNSVGQPGVLVALAAGPPAAMLSRMDDERRKATVVSHVRQVLGESPAQPRNFFSMDWISEPWSLGGYASRRAVVQWTDQRDAVATPRGPIHFAGTETATEWRSYMEGALQSAERASAEVINELGRE